MNKVSWPWIGTTKHEMGSMAPKGDADKDIAPLSNDGSRENSYGTLNPSVSALGDENADDGHEYAGVFFPLHDDILDLQETEFEELQSIASEFISHLHKNATIIGWGPQDDKLLSAVKKQGINVIALNKSEKDEINLSSFAAVNSSIMFYKHRNKCDGFFNSKPFETKEEARISLDNIYSNLKPKSYALLLSSSNNDINDIVKEAGFEILRKYNGKISKLLVKKNSLKNRALIRHHNSADNSVSSFLCDIAKSNQDKVTGLQSYSALSNDCGLLFPYDKPENLTFHMGSVKFPIDIAFIDEDNVIKKIYSNIQPGSLDLFTCAETKNVLEVCGGMTEALGINVGDMVFINYDEDSMNKHVSVANDFTTNSCVIKTSSASDSSFKKFDNFSLITRGNNDRFFKTNILKTASIEAEKEVAVFRLNDFISKDSIPFYRKVSDLGSGARLGLSLYSESFLTSGDLIKVSAEEFYSKSFYKNISKNYMPNLSDIIYATGKNNGKLLNKMRNCLDDGYQLAFVYSGDYEADLIKEAIEVGLNSGYTSSCTYNISDAECMRIPSGFGYENIVDAVGDRFLNRTAHVILNDIEKRAGIPVDNETKAAAKECIEKLDIAKKYAAKLRDNLEQNLSVYERLVQKPDVIKNSAGEYSESSKRNSAICKKVLLKIKDSIGILNSIQDISTTEEVISSLADISKVFSASAIEVFDLVDSLDLDDFVTKLGEATGKSSGSTEDLLITIDRAKAYITKDILGIIILSE